MNNNNSNIIIEKELKILEINKTKVEERLLSLGAKKEFESILEAYYFDTCDNKLKFEKKVLRVRKEHNGVYITVKQQKNDIENLKTHKEINVKSDCIDTAKSLVEALGFRVIAHHKKVRSSYTIENTCFDIDTYLDKHSFIPTLLEIESLDLNTINYYIKALKLGNYKISNRNFFELEKFYEKK